MYHAQRRRNEARREFSAADDLILSLTTTIPDEGLRRNFVARAMAAMPRLPTPSPSQLEKTRFGGLTAREREVAALIAQGKRNHEIAQILVVGSRTVDAHITRILNKLGFSSHTQIAGWAVEKGLARTTPDRES